MTTTETILKTADDIDKTAKEIDRLTDALPHTNNARATFTAWSTGNALLGEQTLREAIARGIRELIRDRETRLAALKLQLRDELTPTELTPTEPTGMDTVINQQTWLQDAQPAPGRREE